MRVALLILAMGLCGCTAQGQYVGADKATFDAVAPEYLDYAEHDPLLSDEQLARRKATIASWSARIEEARGD